MTGQVGALLCLSVPAFLLVNSVWHATARYPRPDRRRIHATNAVLSAAFVALALAGSERPWGDAWPLLVARLWAPIVFYWWVYVWAGRTLHLFHPPEVTYDAPIIALEGRWLGQPSLWLARGRPRWLNEVMNWFYFSYYLYTPALGIALMADGDYRGFEAMALAVCIGYALCYGTYPWTPLWGPRWALVAEGLLPERERVLDGHAVTRFMNGIVWSDTAHKGGAMPSAHSSTAIIFFVWCLRVWGSTGAMIGGAIAVGMYVSTVYGRYHYVVDALVGTAIGLLAIWLADLLVLT